MKQVREIAYVAHDCIELYNMYCTTPPRDGFWALATFVPNYVHAYLQRRRFSIKIQELRDRAKDVGERRERYGVTVPSAGAERERWRGGGGDGEEREQFLSALLQPTGEEGPSSSLPFVSALRRWVSPPDAPFDKAISLLPIDLATDARKIHRGLGLLKPKAAAAAGTDADTAADVCMGMVLRALHAFRQGPAGDMRELQKLAAAAEDDAAADLPKRALTFCYSELSTEEKGCLQYLAAFNREKSISRTSLVRRCAAERLVSDDKEKEQTVEQRAERCFDELLFRGFVSSGAVIGAAGKVKSCRISNVLVKKFIEDMCKQENSQGHGLPTHLQIQIKIRDATLPAAHLPSSSIMPLPRHKDDAIDKMLRELKQLPNTYRLNVIDLGGCVAILNRSHLRRICKQAPTIKYLSLRNTDVDHLPHQLQGLRLLETLDIRQTNIHGSHTRNVFPSSLKHLLAGNVDSDVTVMMPANAREMANLEILSQVRICWRRDLRKIEYHPKLRKLGVVLVPGDEHAVKDLLLVICRLSGCLHSLSVRVATPPINGRPTLEATDGTLSPLPSNLVSLRIDGMRSSGMPSWVERLKKLNKITLCNTLLTDEKLDALAGLPALVYLRLRRRSYSGGELALRKRPGGGGFPALKFLRIEGVTVITELTFEEDAAPALETIAWSSAEPATSYDAVVAVPVTLTRVENLPKLKVGELTGLREHSWPTGPSPLGRHGPGPRKHGTNPVRPGSMRASAGPVPGVGPCLGRDHGPRH
ncbi:hypothetical protein PVAP13_3NG053680 [Panicum virgatum]|uniref:Uncharacterized protein n=2 Tax=Panicum virgatum TaxID=38727 RepID=A0A8T0U5I6_PANVG|nr:hypothetical protein PVAP13_3NG053680 [Panicum virgatum]